MGNFKKSGKGTMKQKNKPFKKKSEKKPQQKLAEIRKAEYENLGNQVEIVTVGKKANGYFKYRNVEPKQNYEGITDEPNFENALQIMTPLVEEFYDGKTNQIELVYTEYQSAMTQTALYKTVLPFEVEQIAKEIESVGGYTFEPSASQVLSNIIPKYTNATIFSALLNASTSEHAARMRAMKAATENAEELIKILSRQSNQARQAEITTEISEIVGGAEALAG